MSYDKALLSVSTISGSAELGQFTLGLAALGQDAAEVLTPIDCSSLTIRQGHQVEEDGGLSIDPSTMTASFRRYASGPVTPSSPVVRDQPVIARYDGDILFEGLITGVACTVETSTEARSIGEQHERTDTISAAGYEHVWSAYRTGHGALPSEPAIERLNRFFVTVSTISVRPAHAWRLGITVPSLPDSGGESRSSLEWARDFSIATRLPVRVYSASLGPQAFAIQVFDDVIDFDNDHPVAVGGLADPTAWLRSVEYEQWNPAFFADVLAPKAASAATDSASQVIGAFVRTWAGLRVPCVIDVFGHRSIVTRLEQGFGETYSASMELTEPLRLAT